MYIAIEYINKWLKMGIESQADGLYFASDNNIVSVMELIKTLQWLPSVVSGSLFNHAYVSIVILYD